MNQEFYPSSVGRLGACLIHASLFEKLIRWRMGEYKIRTLFLFG